MTKHVLYHFLFIHTFKNVICSNNSIVSFSNYHRIVNLLFSIQLKRISLERNNRSWYKHANEQLTRCILIDIGNVSLSWALNSIYELTYYPFFPLRKCQTMMMSSFFIFSHLLRMTRHSSRVLRILILVSKISSYSYVSIIEMLNILIYVIISLI
jgi:hypothetical protein